MKDKNFDSNKCRHQWEKVNTKAYTFRFSAARDADIIARLESAPNKRRLLVDLIRADITK